VPKPPPLRRRCALCGHLTEKWQSIGGGSWHCYDGCQGTLGEEAHHVERTPHMKRVRRLTRKDVKVLKGGRRW
jgi:hypothetical protein